MKLNGIDNCSSILAFVDKRMKVLNAEETNFKNIFEEVFCLKDNVMFEFDVDRRKRHITYGEVYKEINEISPKLNNLLGNLKKDSLVGIYMTNSVLWIEIFWSILKCGFTPILLNVNLSNDRLKKVIKENNVNAVISDNSVDFEVKNIIASEIINSKDKEISNEFGKDVIFMSSGTTNNIKLCYFSPKQFIAQLSNTHAIVRKQPKIYYGYNHELKLLTFLPFYHVFGFFAVYLWFSFVGRTFVLLDKFTSENLFSTVKNHQVTHIFAVPLLWNLIYDGVIKKLKKDEKLYEKFNKALDLSNKINFKNIITKKAFSKVREQLFGNSIQFLISGGSYIAPKVLEFFNGIGYHIVNGFGMTEVGIVAFELSNNKKIMNSCSIGTPFDCFEFKINENKELLIKGSASAYKIMLNGENIKTDEWYNSQDLAKFENNRYFIEGRSDDMIPSISGENLNANYIESNLKVTGIKNIALIKSSDVVLIIEVSSYISFTRYNKIRQEIMNNLIKEKLETSINEIVFTDTKLLGTEFKINHKKILELYENGKINIVKPIETKVDCDINPVLRDKICSLFKKVLNIDTDIDINQNFFFDLGGSSLQYFAMINEIEQEFDIDFPVSDEEKSLSTIKEFCDYLEENI